MSYRSEVERAINAADTALFYLRRSEDCLSSAGNWGIFDLLGGGFISTLAKHSKIDDAKNELENAKKAINQLSYELKSVQQLSNVDIEIGGFLSFADFFFDGFIADWLVQSKIRDAQKQVQEASRQVQNIKRMLLNQSF